MNDTNKLINVPIEFEIRLDFPDIKKGSGGAYVDCPFCGGHKKLFASFKKNVWRCNKCGEFGNAVTLHATMTGTDNKASYKDLQKRFEGLGADAMERLKPQSTGTEITPAPVSLRDYVYREMSNYLDISSKHLDDLHKRGLTDEMIEKLGIKTMPRSGLYSIAKKAIVMTGVAESMQKYHWQIPGFYGNGDVVRMVRRGNGILIPVITHEGKISCYQIRRDDLPEDADEKARERYTRYMYLSSSEKDDGCGCSGIENIHYVGIDFESEMTPTVMNLTEGALKADVASALSGKPFMAVLGANMQSRLSEELRYLKEHGTKQINLMFDMDYQSKPEVAKALAECEKKILDAGLKVKQVKWDPRYKGVDDFLKAWSENRKEFSESGNN